MTLLSSLLSIALLSSSPAMADEPDPGCGCIQESHRAEMQAFRDKIADAGSPEEAREMALSKTRLGHKAIRRAARTLPDSSGLAEAEARLDAFEAGIEGAQTQQEVAMQFDQLMAQRTGISCQYDTVEVVLIVIGFILGILPGVLFLFLFC